MKSLRDELAVPTAAAATVHQTCKWHERAFWAPLGCHPAGTCWSRAHPSNAGSCVWWKVEGVVRGTRDVLLCRIICP